MDYAVGKLLRPAEMVDLLGVSRSWLYDAAKAGRIPCVRLGGSDGPVRFRARELEAWIEGSRMAPPDRGTATRTEDTPAPARRRVEDGDGAQLRFSSDGSG